MKKNKILTEQEILDCFDDEQKKVSTYFPKNSWLGNQNNCNRTIEIITYYRRNLHRYVEEYLGIKLKIYQKIIIYLMGISDTIAIIACRNAAKSFIIAVYVVSISSLYPNSQIIMTSGTRGQSRLIVSKKIQGELMKWSPALNREIESVTSQQNEVEVKFRNGSSIATVTLGMRGNRATVVLGEEAREINKKKFDESVVPMKQVRPAAYLARDYYENIVKEYEQLLEKPKEIYISSSIEEEHWLYKTARECRDGFLKHNGNLFLAFDLSILLKEGLKRKDSLAKEKSQMDSMTWAIEYENAVMRTNTKAFFNYDMIKENLVAQKAFYPRIAEDVLNKKPNKYAIPKLKDEIRIVSCDIAMIDRNGNDNSCSTCIRCIPNTYTTFNGKQETKYTIQVPYLEAPRGKETTKQAVRIRQLYEDFNADYIVLDTRSGGTGIYDALAKVLYDEERCCEYEPFKSMNDEVFANRFNNPYSKPVIYCVNASLKLNSEIALMMKSMLLEHKIELLVSREVGIENIKKFVPEYRTTDDPDLRMFYEKPYLETMLLFSEMVALEYDKTDLGIIKIHEKPSETKDRYSSLSYGCMFAQRLERDLLKQDDDIPIDEAPVCVSNINF